MTNTPPTSNYQYLISQSTGTLTILLPTYTAVWPAGCPVSAPTLVLESIEGKPFSSFISVDQQAGTASVATADVNLNGVYNFRVIAQQGSISNTDYTFSLTLFDGVIPISCTTLTLNSSPSDQVSYVIGADPIIVPFPTYTGLPAGCPLSLVYEVQLVTATPDPSFASASSNAAASTLPTLLTNDSTSFTIYGLN